MKSNYALVTLILVTCFGVKAQMPVVVSEDSLKLSKTSIPGLAVTIPEVNYEKTLKAWIKELESGTKSKVVTDNNEMTIFGARIKAISPNPINVYSKLSTFDTLQKLVVAFELKKDQYINRTGTPAEFSQAQNYLKMFSKDQYIELAKDQVDAEDKKLRDIQKELSSLEKEKNRMQKSIQSDNTDIMNEKNNIVVQNNEVTTVSATIVEQSKLLDTMAAGPAKEEKMKYLKELDKRKNKALNSVESSQNKINRANNDIDKTNSEIPKNDTMQAQVREKVTQQEAVLQKYTDKLKKIRSY